MKKIYVTKQESAASVISKVLKSKDETVVLYVPRGTKFAASRNNFVLLKRETRAAKRAVMVESVDDDVLELAATSGFKAVNPFLGKRRRAVSDIVVVGKREKEGVRERERER